MNKTLIVPNAPLPMTLQVQNPPLIPYMAPTSWIDMMRNHLINLDLPQQTLYFGLHDDDGLPVLLDLKTPCQGSLKILGKAGTGKTALFQCIAAGIARRFDPNMVQFAVVTDTAFEWTGWETLPQCSGIFSIRKHFGRLLDGLLLWMQRPNRTQSLVLLIENLDRFISYGGESDSRLRNLLLHGPSCNIWPMVTVNSETNASLSGLSDCFNQHLISLTVPNPSIFNFKYMMNEHAKWSSFSLFG